MRPTALTGIFAFAVFADYDPVEITTSAIAEGGLCAAEDLCRAHICVLLEGLADGQSQAPEGDVVRDIYLISFCS